MSQLSDRVPPPSDRRRLDSWKEIAAHLGRTVRTVQRWERDEGLPVHRHVHHKLSSVYAYTDEIDRWWAQTQLHPGEADIAALTSTPAASVPGIDERHDGPAVSEPPDFPPSESPLLQQPTSPQRPSVPESWRASRLVVAVGLGGISLLVLLGLANRRDDTARAAVATARAAAEAADLYRQGRSFWQQRTPRGFEQARFSFEAAIAANPDDPQAHAGLADTYSLLEAFGLMAAGEALPKARAEAERAVQLEPNLGEAHASLAFVLWELHDTVGAMAEMERALELDPDYPTAHHWYGLFLQQFLRRAEAIAEVRRAVALDPSQPIFWTELAGMLKFARRFDEAEDVLGRARARHPGFPDIYIQLSDLALERDDTSQAVALLRRAVALGDNRPRIVSKLGCLEGTTGNRAGAVEALTLLREIEASGQHVPDDAFASMLAWTGDLDGAFRHITRALEQRQEWVAGLFEPSGCFDPVRRDPRWARVVAELEHASWLPLGSRVALPEAKADARPPARPLRAVPGGY